MIKMISNEEFSSMTYEEQKEYMIYVVSMMSDKERKKFYEKIKESGILEENND